MVHGPNAAAACFCKLSFIGTQPCLFTYLLSVAAFALKQQSCVAIAETEWPVSKYSLYGPL